LGWLLVVLGTAAAASFGVVSTARAYTGGPALVEVLGWDGRSQRVYVRLFPAGESDTFGEIRFMATDSLGRVRTGRPAWNRPELASDDSRQTGELGRLRRSLEPLHPAAFPTLPQSNPTVTAIDTVDVPRGRVAAYHLRARFDLGPEFECTSYGREFAIKDMYPLPGRGAALYVVVFRGNPHDGLLAETQVPVIVGSKEELVRVSWEP
jgi:hypothetical protein